MFFNHLIVILPQWGPVCNDWVWVQTDQANLVKTSSVWRGKQSIKLNINTLLFLGKELGFRVSTIRKNLLLCRFYILGTLSSKHNKVFFIFSPTVDPILSLPVPCKRISLVLLLGPRNAPINGIVPFRQIYGSGKKSTTINKWDIDCLLVKTRCSFPVHKVSEQSLISFVSSLLLTQM